MKIETAKLEGAALDWAVAKCEGYAPLRHSRLATVMVEKMNARGVMQPEHISSLRYSTNWAQGGPIIERERIDIWCYESDLSLFRANIQGSMKPDQQARTMLLAAMRCYVTSKLGDEVEVPEALLK